MIGPYPTIGLREARGKREEAKKQFLANIDPSSAKREAKASAAEAALNSFEVVAKEWLERYSGSWTPAYKGYMICRLEKNIFPYIGKRPTGNITVRELLGVLRRVEERGALTTVHHALWECGPVLRYAIITGRAERGFAADLRVRADAQGPSCRHRRSRCRRRAGKAKFETDAGHESRIKPGQC